MNTGARFYLDLEGILDLFRGFRDFEEFRDEQDRLGVFRGPKDLTVLLKVVGDASLRQVFSVEEVSEKFYREFVGLFRQLREEVRGVAAKHRIILV